eukprot:TRINITY_DN2546_c0_g1_i13.p1 TRINITY_DN2546_c0_g1~~TRINITY_DN2546_c0_g1_i13.p1  ORF type:complete len:629 (+),score=130.30 TRINITY_DN2546_c0_g1_i13:128-2014(+)
MDYLSPSPTTQQDTSLSSHPDPDNDPPYSRLFVTCSKDLTEQDIISYFEPFGKIEYCRLLREKRSNESKGVGFVKFSKASSAALAVEALQTPPDHPSTDLPIPLKAIIADPKTSTKQAPPLPQQQIHAPSPVPRRKTPPPVMRAPSPSPMAATTTSNHDDTPPQSRLFVVCSKKLDQQALQKLFSPYSADMEYCRLTKDKVTGESKGYAYVKFFQSSTAARAIRDLNGQPGPDDRKLKVMLAEPKAHTDTPRDFALPPARPSQAALAPPSVSLPLPVHMGQPSNYTVVTPPGTYPASYLPSLNALHMHALASSLGLTTHLVPHGVPVSYPLPYAVPVAPSPPRQRLYVVVPKSVTQEQLSRIFNKFPGMEYCDLKKDKVSGESKGFAFVNYSTAQAASSAKDHLHGHEIPGTGFPMKVMLAEPLGSKHTSAPTSPRASVHHPDIGEHPSVTAMRDSFMMLSFPSTPAALPSSSSRMPPSFVPPPGFIPPPAFMQASGQQSTSTHLKHAEHMRGHSPPTQDHTDTNDMHRSTGEASLHGEGRNYPEGSRLFIVLTKQIPEYILRDLFSRFGGLEYVRLQRDKNYGFAKYTTAREAQYAQQCLHGAEVHGQLLKVHIAAPPSDSRKRQRI